MRATPSSTRAPPTISGHSTASRSIAHVWWYEGVKAVGPSRAAIFMNLQPVVGVVLAWAMLREAVEWPEIVGGALVLLGVALTTQAPLSPRAAS